MSNRYTHGNHDEYENDRISGVSSQSNEDKMRSRSSSYHYETDRRPSPNEHRSRSMTNGGDSRNLVLIDGQQWDLSNLCDGDDQGDGSLYPHYLGRKTPPPPEPEPPKSTIPREISRRDEEVKKSHNDNFTLKPKPKFEWRNLSSREEESDSDSEPALPEEQNYRNQTRSQEREEDDMERVMIEVFPGVEMPLRGSAETQTAISEGRIKTATCLDCTLGLSCIQDAEYILCPLCHCISPLELSSAEVAMGAFGVGLGFVADDH